MSSVTRLVLSAGLIYAVLCILMGVIPGLTLSSVAPTPGLQPLTAEQRHGRDIYVSEGCSYCHTQFVRPLKQDLVFGRPSVAGDYVYDTPQLLGTERTGPDLTNIGTRQPSKVWQYIHLWDPRALIHDSIMPRYTWLFAVKAQADPSDVQVSVPPGFGPASGVVVATKDAQDLVAYIESLKQVSLRKDAPK